MSKHMRFRNKYIFTRQLDSSQIFSCYFVLCFKALTHFNVILLKCYNYLSKILGKDYDFVFSCNSVVGSV